MEKIKLKYAVKTDGVEITELEMRRPKVKDMRLAGKTSKSEEEKEVTLISNLCAVAPETIDELDFADYAQCQEALKSFLG